MVQILFDSTISQAIKTNLFTSVTDIKRNTCRNDSFTRTDEKLLKFKNVSAP